MGIYFFINKRINLKEDNSLLKMGSTPTKCENVEDNLYESISRLYFKNIQNENSNERIIKNLILNQVNNFHQFVR